MNKRNCYQSLLTRVNKEVLISKIEAKVGPVILPSNWKAARKDTLEKMQSDKLMHVKNDKFSFVLVPKKKKKLVVAQKKKLEIVGKKLVKKTDEKKKKRKEKFTKFKLRTKFDSRKQRCSMEQLLILVQVKSKVLKKMGSQWKKIRESMKKAMEADQKNILLHDKFSFCSFKTAPKKISHNKRICLTPKKNKVRKRPVFFSQKQRISSIAHIQVKTVLMRSPTKEWKKKRSSLRKKIEEDKKTAIVCDKFSFCAPSPKKKKTCISA